MNYSCIKLDMNMHIHLDFNLTKVVVLVLRIPEHFSLHFSDFYKIF